MEVEVSGGCERRPGGDDVPQCHRRGWEEWIGATATEEGMACGWEEGIGGTRVWGRE
jgi:hypothetical protein